MLIRVIRAIAFSLQKILIMQFVVLADDSLKEELLSKGKNGDAEIIWLSSIEQFSECKNADVYCDLLFDGSANRTETLKNISRTVIVNSVDKTLQKLQAPFIRINGWPGFLKGTIIEASCNDESKIKPAEFFFRFFQTGFLLNCGSRMHDLFVHHFLCCL